MRNGWLTTVACGVAAMVMVCAGSSAAQYSGGSGTSGDPWRIADASDLIAIGANTQHYGDDFILTADIDMADYHQANGPFTTAVIAPDTDPDNKSFDGIAFTGTLDGDGHVVRNLVIGVGYSHDYLAMFGSVDGAEIRDLGVESGWVSGDDNVAGLAAYSRDAVYTSCYVTGSFTGDSKASGLVADSFENTFTSCHVAGEVASSTSAGGLAASSSGTTFTSCYSTASVNGWDDVGGLVGRSNYGVFTSCYATSTVTGGSWNVGGLVGLHSDGTITSCFTTGAVSGGARVGGLVGHSMSSPILFCYTTGAVSGHDITGGLVGFNQSSITSCYATGTVGGGTLFVGGLLGSSGGDVRLSFWDVEASGIAVSYGGFGRSTAQMQSAQTYWGWGDGAWRIAEGAYPRLAWEGAAGETIDEIPSRIYGGGGIDGNPFVISSAADLVCMTGRMVDWDKHFELADNIDMAGVEGYLPPIFLGVLEGDGHVISNLTIDEPGSSLLGVLGGLGGEVRNLGVEGVSVTGHNAVGGLVGYKAGTIESCYASGSVLGADNVGGLVGFNFGPISSSYYAAGSTVTGVENVGGLVGYLLAGEVASCYSAGDVISEGSNVGGLAGPGFFAVCTFSYFLDSAGPDNGLGTPLSDAAMREQASFFGFDFVGVGDGDADLWAIYEEMTYPYLAWQTFSANDCDGNGVPDELDLVYRPDCNENEVPDACDIAIGGSNDVNSNGIPDECESDCNDNGVPDSWEISQLTAADCNGNGVPDACDITAGTSPDCNTNGVPDECEPDCNGNDIPDDCDITAGLSLDCNTNGVPDECEPDCNGNDIPDDCDITAGTSLDCNVNGLPDECELDCNGNGVPDECDVVGGASNDVNSNGVPDECEPDCNANDVPDSWEISQQTAVDCNGNDVPDDCELVALTEIKLTAPDAVAGYDYGFAVSVDGNVALIGCAPDWISGSAYIYHWNGFSWVEQAELTGTGLGDRFGASVSISGDVAVVGAPLDDDNGIASGAAYIYHWDGVSWIERAKLRGTDGAEGDQLGFSVSVSGDVAVIGAHGDGEAALSAGAAYVLVWDGATWAVQAKLTASDAAASDYFGYSVSVNGDVAVIGARADDDGGSSSGSAYVYRWNGSSWAEEAKLRASDAASYDFFGSAVSVSGDVVAIGAHENDDGGSASGSAYIYRWNGSSWIEQARLTASDAASYDWFGSSVSISEYAAVIGAPNHDDGGVQSGSAYVFVWDGAAWVEYAKLAAADATAIDRFGSSVSIAASWVVIGAPGDGVWGSNSGSAYVFAPSGSDCNGDSVLDECHATGSGDFDADGDVNLIDYIAFVECMAGPDALPTPSNMVCVAAYLVAFDFDSDGDVDLVDAAAFAELFGGL